MGFQVRFQLGRIPVFHPEVIEMRDIGTQLDDDTVDVGIPLEIVCVAQVGLHLRNQGIPHLDGDSRVDGNGSFLVGDSVVQRDMFDLSWPSLSGRRGLDDPVHSLFQVFHGGGVGEADVVRRRRRHLREQWPRWLL